MTSLFLFPEARKRDPAVDAWLNKPGDLHAIARKWFDRMRRCGPDVRELMHDGCPTACVEDAAFAYVNVFTAHVNAGFFRGAELPDPSGLLEGTGRYMRHVKLRPGPFDGFDRLTAGTLRDRDRDAALSALIDTAYLCVKAMLKEE